MSTPAARRILAQFEASKDKRIDRDDKKALKEKLKEEEAEARQKLDKKVVDDQKAEKEYDEKVKQYKEIGRRELEKRGHDTQTRPGSYDYGNNPRYDGGAPNTFSDRVNEIVERANRETTDLKTNLAIATELSKDVETEAAEVRGKLEGMASPNPQKLNRLKVRLAEKQKEYDKIEAERIKHYNECAKNPETLKYATQEIRHRYRHGQEIRSRIEKYIDQNRVRAHCAYVNTHYRKYLRPVAAELRTLTSAVEEAEKWHARFASLIRVFAGLSKDEYLDRKERALLTAKVDEASRLIEKALKAGADSAFHQITELNQVRLAALNNLKRQEGKILQAKNDEAAESIQGPPAPTDLPPGLGTNLAGLASTVVPTVEVSIPGLGQSLTQFAAVLENYKAPEPVKVEIDTAPIAAALEGMAIDEAKLAKAFGQALWPNKDQLVDALKTIQNAQYELARAELSDRIRG